jgi:integrase
MASGIEIRGDSIRISVQFRGKRLRFTLPLDGTKRAHLKQANKIRKKMVSEIAAGTFVESDYREEGHHQAPELGVVSIDTFSALVTDYLSTGMTGLAHGTKKKYTQGANFWNAKLAGWKVSDFTFSNLRRTVESIAWPGPKTKNNSIGILRGILQIWVDDQKLDENPAKRIKNSKTQEPPPDPLTAIEVDVVLEYMSRNYPETIANYFEFMFFSGLRPEETIALRNSDVLIGIPGMMDCVHVSKALTAGKEKPTTKGYRVRDVQLNGRSKLAVERQMKLSNAIGIEHLFFNPNTMSSWISEKSQRELYWHPTLAACNIRRRFAYQTRHTFASLSLSAGAQPLWLSTQMGHSTPKMIFERYARWIQGYANSQEHTKIETMFAPKALSQKCPEKEKK